jgi:hypothetical protein
MIEHLYFSVLVFLSSFASIPYQQMLVCFDILGLILFLHT